MPKQASLVANNNIDFVEFQVQQFKLMTGDKDFGVSVKKVWS